MFRRVLSPTQDQAWNFLQSAVSDHSVCMSGPVLKRDLSSLQRFVQFDESATCSLDGFALRDTYKSRVRQYSTPTSLQAESEIFSG